MPTPSTSSFSTGPRHAAPPNRDRFGVFLTTSWATLHVPVLVLLSVAVQHHGSAGGTGRAWRTTRV